MCQEDAWAHTQGVWRIPVRLFMQLEMVYGEVFRVLKPGSRFVSYEWVSTHKFDANNAQHVKIIDEINFGNGLPVSSRCMHDHWLMLHTSLGTTSRLGACRLAVWNTLSKAHSRPMQGCTAWNPHMLALTSVLSPSSLCSSGDAHIQGG